MAKYYRRLLGSRLTGSACTRYAIQAATNALDTDSDIAKVQEWLGHANISNQRRNALITDQLSPLRDTFLNAPRRFHPAWSETPSTRPCTNRPCRRHHIGAYTSLGYSGSHSGNTWSTYRSSCRERMRLPQLDCRSQSGRSQAPVAIASDPMCLQTVSARSAPSIDGHLHACQRPTALTCEARRLAIESPEDHLRPTCSAFSVNRRWI